MALQYDDPSTDHNLECCECFHYENLGEFSLTPLGLVWGHSTQKEILISFKEICTDYTTEFYDFGLKKLTFIK